MTDEEMELVEKYVQEMIGIGYFTDFPPPGFPAITFDVNNVSTVDAYRLGRIEYTGDKRRLLEAVAQSGKRSLDDFFCVEGDCHTHGKFRTFVLKDRTDWVRCACPFCVRDEALRVDSERFVRGMRFKREQASDNQQQKRRG